MSMRSKSNRLRKLEQLLAEVKAEQQQQQLRSGDVIDQARPDHTGINVLAMYRAYDVK